jgi:hypothetical protein
MSQGRATPDHSRYEHPGDACLKWLEPCTTFFFVYSREHEWNLDG